MRHATGVVWRDGRLLRVTTEDNSQLGNNAATRVISMLYNHSLA